MTRHEIIAAIRENADAIKGKGVLKLAIFGSRARDDAHDDSDLDVLIDLQPEARFSLLNLSGVGLLIEDATGLPTQVVLRRSAAGDFHQRIQGDLKTVF